MTEILAGMLGGFVWGTVLIFSTGIFKNHIVPLIFKKEPDEIEMLEQTLWRKHEELNRRNQMEMLSAEIERLDEHLYPEEKETRHESLNDSMDAVMYSLDNEFKRPSNPPPNKCVNPIPYMGVTAEEAAESHNRATRNLRRETDRKAHNPFKWSEKDINYMANKWAELSRASCIDVRPDKPGPTYPEVITAYADGVVIEKVNKYPPLKNVGGNADE